MKTRVTMIPTIQYIENKFDEFNALMFGNKLPKLPVTLSNARTFLGQCAYRKKRLANGRIQRFDFKLRISIRFDLPEKEIEDTIIHEMIHYYIGVNNLEDKSSHGPLFRSIMNTINEKYGRNLTISRKSSKEECEQMYDTTKRWHVIAVVSFADGKTGVKVLPRIVQRIVNYYHCVCMNPIVSDVHLYMSNDTFFNRYPNSSALRVTYIDREEVMSHLHDAERLLCDGHRIIRNA